MDYTKKLLYQSNYWYNDGLKRAKIRDTSGSINSLKKSLQYNRENIAARNLLGLIYYGRGEVGEAVVEWILSKNFRSHDNIANYYIKKVQENPGELDKINQAIRMFNQSLDYCYQGGEDMAVIQLKKVIDAHPSFLKAYQLLALLYLHMEQYGKARHMLKEALKLDTTNEITLLYMHELRESRKNHSINQRRKKEEKTQTVTYNIGNETIIQPAGNSVKENTGLMTIINIAIGLLVGVAAMWFLVMPAVNKSTADKTNKQVVKFSDKIAEQEAQISALKTELEGYRTTSGEAEEAQETARSTSESYEIVLDMYGHFTAEDMSDAAMVEELIKVKPKALGDLGKERYDTITETVYPRYGDVLYSTAQENYTAENYKDAISNLDMLMKMDQGFEGGQAMWLLSKAYEKNGDEDSARKWKDKVEEKYPDVDTSKEPDTGGSSDDGSYDDGYYDDGSDGYYDDGSYDDGYYDDGSGGGY